MGNILAVNVNIDKLFSLCFQQEDARKNLVDFQHDWGLLKAAKIDVINTIEIEERQQMRPTAAVNQWLQRITTLEDPAEKLIDEYIQEYAKKCFCGYCRKNYKKCYEFKRKMAPMVKEVKELLELKPAVLAQRILMAPTQQIPTEPTNGMQLMLDDAMSQIGDDEKVGMIGLYGMGGVGKTTLLKEINNKICNSEPKSFDLLLWIVVSKTPNLEEIRNTIAAKIGLQHDGVWINKNQEQKKLDIFNVLNKKKYILLLDDIWERLDLAKVGLPHPSATNKSKVIFTTRSKTLCGEMKAREIQVKCLTEKESWYLFRENVGESTLNAHPDIHEIAKVVMKECKGLPLALKVIGRAMTCKTSPQSWKLAIKLLERNTALFSSMGDEVFPILKYSYDSLPNTSIKSCFLCCSLYPEDKEILKKDLIDKWICEGYMDGFNDLYDARYAGYDYISTLVNASLLEEWSPEKFKLHDVIRDMAIWIGCECGKIKDKFLVQTQCHLRQMPNASNWGSVERMSFIGNDIEELTEIQVPDCPKTLTLFLQSNKLRWIDSGFFDSLLNLRVIDLSKNKGLKVLPNEIGALVNLQYLNLSDTGIEELPAKFKKLVALEYLNLENIEIQSNIRKGELRSCEKLQVLKLRDGYYERSRDLLKDGGDHPTRIAARTLSKDLNSLKWLQDLTFNINGETNLSEFTSSVKLLSITSSLTLEELDESRWLDMSFLDKMIHLDSLVMAEMQLLEKINVRNESSFNSLRRLKIITCPMLEDLTWIALAPNIEIIEVVSCERMKRLVGRSTWDENVDEPERQRIPFSKLERLRLSDLQELGSIYPTSLSFPCLSELKVCRCENLKKLPFNSNSCNGGQISIRGTEDWWNNVQWEDEATTTKFSSTFSSTFY